MGKVLLALQDEVVGLKGSGRREQIYETTHSYPEDLVELLPCLPLLLPCMFPSEPHPHMPLQL